MTNYVLRRILLLIPTMLVIFTITFFLMHATPGGPWDAVGRPLPLHVIENLNVKYGLDKPVWQQYLIFLWGILSRGDLGDSYSRVGQSVSGIIAGHFPVSLQLGLAAMTVALVGGVGLGLVGAIKPNTWLDNLTTFLSVFGISTPNYVVATLMVILFAVYLGWLPTGGWDSLFSVKAIIPVFALILSQDYIRTIRAKGAPEPYVFIVHGLRNALIPVVTVTGIGLANVVTGSFFVESILNIPGIGRYFVTSVTARDYPVIMGTTLLYAALVMVMNLVVDILYTFLDPRIGYE